MSNKKNLGKHLVFYDFVYSLKTTGGTVKEHAEAPPSELVCKHCRLLFCMSSACLLFSTQAAVKVKSTTEN